MRYSLFLGQPCLSSPNITICCCCTMKLMYVCLQIYDPWLFLLLCKYKWIRFDIISRPKWVCFNEMWWMLRGRNGKVMYYFKYYTSNFEIWSAPLAQLAERRSHNPEVVSSILTGSITPFYTKYTLGPIHIVCGTDGVTPPRMSYKGSWWKGNGYFDLSYVCVPATWNRKKSCEISDAWGKWVSWPPNRQGFRSEGVFWFLKCAKAIRNRSNSCEVYHNYNSSKKTFTSILCWSKHYAMILLTTNFYMQYNCTHMICSKMVKMGTG